MKLIYKGKYKGNELDLPQREHPEGAVPFKEPQDMKTLTMVANALAIGFTVVLLVLLWVRAGHFVISYPGVIMSLATIFPHEFLHAICFRKEVYMYQNLKQGLMFVVGPEDMSKTRFVVMSLCPNMIFGIIPFLLFMINPQLEMWGTLGAFALGMGVCDYMNVFHALTQMPKGAKTYLSGMHSFWYIP